jgi:hypothetical protein
MLTSLRTARILLDVMRLDNRNIAHKATDNPKVKIAASAPKSYPADGVNQILLISGRTDPKLN